METLEVSGWSVAGVSAGREEQWAVLGRTELLQIGASSHGPKMLTTLLCVLSDECKSVHLESGTEK